MRLKKLSLILLVFLPIHAFCQSYAVSDIPDSLLKNSNAVKRFEEVIVTLSDNGYLNITRKYAITILNEAADKYGWYQNYYSKLRDLKKN